MPVSKPTLIPEWRGAWRTATVTLANVGTAAALGWLALNDAQQAAVLGFVGLKSAGWGAVALFAAITFGRHFQFTKPADPPFQPTVPQTEQDLERLPVEK